MYSDLYLGIIFIAIFIAGIIALNIVSSIKRRKLEKREKAHGEFYGGTSNLSIVIAGIGHELSSPVTAIDGFLSLLNKRVLNGTASEEEILRVIKMCIEQADALSGLINDFRGLAKLQRQKNFVPTKLHELIRNVLKSFIHAYPKILFTAKLETFKPARIVPNQIMLALSQIINNSVEAIGKNNQGIISINLRLQKCNDGDDSDICIEINDNGGGIKHLSEWKIFQPFKTAGKKKGTGLGLFFCKQIIENHHGNIEAISDYKKGMTTLKLTIPYK